MNQTRRMTKRSFGRRSWFVPGAAAAMLTLTLVGHAAQAQAQTPVAVHAALRPSTDDIRDIRGPKPLGGVWMIPLLVLGGLVTGAVVYGSWFWSGRRAGRPRTPAEMALERLGSPQTLVDGRNGREFSIEVSGIVREYIEQQFQLSAAHRTTDEFLHDLIDPSHRALNAHRDNLARFLETCDLAKFGGWNLSAADMEMLRSGAVRFVTESASIMDASPTIADDPPTASAPTDVLKPPSGSPPSLRPQSTTRRSHAAFPST